MGKPTQCIAGGGLLAAIAAVLQLVGSAIRFGPFSVSLVLIPIVLGAALYGWGMGCWLGLVFGAVVLLSGDAGLFLAADPGGAIVTVLSKGIACGAAAGLCCRWLHPRYPRLSILLSALAAPLVNRGGGSAGLPTVFHALHPSVGAAGGLCQRRSLSDGGHGGLSLHTGDHRWLGTLRGAPVPPGGRLRRGSAAAWPVEALRR